MFALHKLIWIEGNYRVFLSFNAITSNSNHNELQFITLFELIMDIWWGGFLNENECYGFFVCSIGDLWLSFGIISGWYLQCYL